LILVKRAIAESPPVIVSLLARRLAEHFIDISRHDCIASSSLLINADLDKPR